jgi:hypothetical protein
MTIARNRSALPEGSDVLPLTFRSNTPRRHITPAVDQPEAKARFSTDLAELTLDQPADLTGVDAGARRSRVLGFGTLTRGMH